MVVVVVGFNKGFVFNYVFYVSVVLPFHTECYTVFIGFDVRI